MEEVSRYSQTGWRVTRTLSQAQPIEDEVASSTCHSTILQCDPEVLGRYTAHLVEREQVRGDTAAKIEALLDSAGHDGGDRGVVVLMKQVRWILGIRILYPLLDTGPHPVQGGLSCHQHGEPASGCATTHCIKLGYLLHVLMSPLL